MYSEFRLTLSLVPDRTLYPGAYVAGSQQPESQPAPLHRRIIKTVDKRAGPVFYLVMLDSIATQGLDLPTGLVPGLAFHSGHAAFYPLMRLTVGGPGMDYQTMLHESAHETTFDSTWPTYHLFREYWNGHAEACVEYYRLFVEAVAVAEALLRCNSVDYHLADARTRELGTTIWELCHRLPDIPCTCGISRALTLNAVGAISMNHQRGIGHALTPPQDVVLHLTAAAKGGKLRLRPDNIRGKEDLEAALAEFLNAEGYHTAHVCPHCDLELVTVGLCLSLSSATSHQTLNSVLATLLPTLICLLGRDCLELQVDRIEHQFLIRAHPQTIRDFRVELARSRQRRCPTMAAKLAYMQHWQVLEKDFLSHKPPLSRRYTSMLVDAARRGRVPKKLRKKLLGAVDERDDLKFTSHGKDPKHPALIDHASAKLIEGAVAGFFNTTRAYLERLAGQDVDCEYCQKIYSGRSGHGLANLLTFFKQRAGVDLDQVLEELLNQTQREFVPWLADRLSLSSDTP